MTLSRDQQHGLGMRLSGHRDTKQLSTFVVDLEPAGVAERDGRVSVGDELLEVNGHVLHGRSHVNAASIIAGIESPALKFLLIR